MSSFTFNFPNNFNYIYSVYFNFFSGEIRLQYCGWLQKAQPVYADIYQFESYYFGTGLALMGYEQNVQGLSANTLLRITNSSIIFSANDNFTSYASYPRQAMLEVWLCVV